MIEIIIEIESGMISGVYTDAAPEQDFNVAVLDRDFCDEEGEQEAEQIASILRGPGWRGIDQ